MQAPPPTSRYNVNLTRIVHSDQYSNIWICPPTNHGASDWWCGNSTEATPCQNASNSVGRFETYTGGIVLGLPPITSSSAPTPPATTNAQATPAPSLLTASPHPVASNKPSQSPTVSQSRGENYSTAIGVGIGVPLGVAVIGCLAFLLWREQRRNHFRKPVKLAAGLDPSLDLAAASNIERREELPNSQIPRELDHSVGKVEISANE